MNRGCVVLVALAACKSHESPRPRIAIADGDDWIRPMANGRYLETAAGEPFVPIGNQPGTGFLDLPDAAIEAHFARMEAAGENVARIDLDYGYAPKSGPTRYLGLESRLGVFDPARIARIDVAFAAARTHHVRLLVVPFVTSPPMWETWAGNPYGTALGGPAHDPHDFMVSADARAAFGRRMDWITARWGASSTLFGWDLMNEANILEAEGHHDPRGLASWIDELGGRVERTARAAFGRTHLRMVSASSMIPAREYAFLFRAPATFSAPKPGVAAARAYLDTQYNALMQTELIGGDGRVLKSFSLIDLKKVGEQWLPKSADFRNAVTRDKTRFQVTGAALNLALPAEVFEPAGLAAEARPPAVEKITRIEP